MHIKLFKHKFVIKMQVVKNRFLEFDLIIKASDRENAEVSLKTILHSFDYEIIEYRKLDGYPETRKSRK